ncbi:hypothetical protein CYMTET_15378 [Cymbomonas tetramitiformis]|uniref:Uncharacterized protein n=1 Tax=Cymbomonas tetramitiformis TaxID=36881 RepID=A0AAE0GE56_9CHLO|nr:hypothetical protein CYMTET_15378 [Cymbomonas tetramitiformis]|eukprot:gene22264-26854_t
MDTVVRDPFYEDIPAFFGMSLKELFSVKHPTAWLDFEKGLMDEEEFAATFFEDGRDFDYEGLKDTCYAGYQWIDGMEELLQELSTDGYHLHAFSNYPLWYEMVERKLGLSRYLEWSAVSCNTHLRKPDPASYDTAARVCGADPHACIFVDDNEKNIIAAREVGMMAIHFESQVSLRERLQAVL